MKPARSRHKAKSTWAKPAPTERRKASGYELMRSKQRLRNRYVLIPNDCLLWEDYLR